MTFGLLSSLFDYLTFGVLLLILNASPEEFRTGWFVESVISASLVVLVIRTRGPFFQSRPGKSLFIATLLIVGIALALPFIPIGGTLFGFTPLPVSFLALMILIVALYIASAEVAKKIFYKHVRF
jgi:Mg2+-importing ATPase